MEDFNGLLGEYELSTPLSNKNSGYSVWGFGHRNGRDFFIKQFLSPVYPENDYISSPELISRKLTQCEAFEQQKIALYRKVNENSDGNVLRISELFRIGSHYYCATPKLNALPLGIEEIAQMRNETVSMLCATIAHSVASFHRGGVVHADLKHTNIMFVHSKSGNITAKIIDFDSSFLECAPPKPGDDIVGDQVYFSPEACKSIWGDAVALTCKMDVFAMGILFHQYFTGEVPGFSDYFYSAGEAVANGELLKLSDALPNAYKELILQMLEEDPVKRPTAQEVFLRFAPPIVSNEPDIKLSHIEDKKVLEIGSAFYVPGNL